MKTFFATFAGFLAVGLVLIYFMSHLFQTIFLPFVMASHLANYKTIGGPDEALRIMRETGASQRDIDNVMERLYPGNAGGQ